MADVEVHSSGRAWALYGEKHGDHLVHSSPLGYTYRKLNFTDTKLDTNEILFFFFPPGQVYVRKKMKPHSLKLWLNTIMKGFGGL